MRNVITQESSEYVKLKIIIFYIYILGHALSATMQILQDQCKDYEYC